MSLTSAACPATACVTCEQNVDTAAVSSGVQTRTELLARRKHDRLHVFDKYDLDGDGVVRPRGVNWCKLSCELV